MKADQAINHLIVNGCFRSGTTLLDKLLNLHPELLIASQPFPNLFFYAKEAYLKSNNIPFRYALSHMLNQQSDFLEFLEDYKLNHEDLDRIFQQLGNYTNGLKTPEILECRKNISPGFFIDVLKQFNTTLQDIFKKQNVSYNGSKEAFIEEYIPFLLKHNSKVVVIIRDPRSVIASVYYSNSEKFMGDERPLLYLLRTWRKSVAYALGYESNPGLCFITYEELTKNTIGTLNKISQFLGVSPFKKDDLKGELKDQYNNVWQSNSSFTKTSEITENNNDRYRELLDEKTLQFIEATCFPEMLALGYKLESINCFQKTYLSNYKEPFDITHPMFLNDKDYSYKKESVSTEVQRIKLLKNSELKQKEINDWFITEDCYKKLFKASCEFIKNSFNSSN